jgi:hypothetical protein
MVALMFALPRKKAKIKGYCSASFFHQKADCVPLLIG